MDPFVIPFSFPGLEHIRCGFSTRCGGISPEPYASANISYDVGDAPLNVSTNRERLKTHLQLPTWHELRQVHGTVLRCDPDFCNTGHPSDLEGDGLATHRAGQVLVIKTADCQPILLAHAGGRHIAALHCGWRGNRAGFPEQGVREFCTRYELDPADIMAVRGPSLSPAHAEFVHFESEWGDEFSAYFDARTQTVDLWALTREQLLSAGLQPDRIFSIDLCTLEREDLFFSYRRVRISGRQASFIWRKDKNES